MKLRVALVIVLLCMVAPAHAQSPECDPAQVFALMTTVKSAGDTAADLAALTALSDAITAQHIACDGFTFEGKGNQVIGPIELPEGAYILHAESTDVGGFTITPDVSKGECARENGLDTINGYSFETANISEGILRSKGCTLTLQVEYFARKGSRTWTLTLAPA